VAAPQRRADNVGGTIWRTLRAVLFIALLICVVYALYSAVVALSTADKCGQLHTNKEWSYFPPEWECK
jgi:hypothetical protein